MILQATIKKRLLSDFKNITWYYLMQIKKTANKNSTEILTWKYLSAKLLLIGQPIKTHLAVMHFAVKRNAFSRPAVELGAAENEKSAR